MRNKTLFSILITLLFLSQTSISASQEGDLTDYKLDEFAISEDAFTIPDWKLDYINERKELRFHNESETFEGYTLFNCDWDGRANASSIIVDMGGDIVAAFNDFRGGPELINSTTILFQNNTHFVFWNMETNITEYVETPLISILGLHHDYEYNPITDQFLILGRESNGTVDIGGSDYTIVHDTISLIDRNNNTLWHWRGYEYIPFDQEYFYLTNHTGRGSTADWTHANAIFWDMEEENIVYLNARHTHTVYKIDMLTGDIIWTLGEYDGDFTLFNKNGLEVSSLFYGAHSIEKIGLDKFIIYDNDEFNTTDMSSNWPRYVEFAINETDMTAKETWTWVIPDNSTYIGDHWGDVDHLPGDTRLGTFGAGGDTSLDLLTEVNDAGEIIWELAINGTDTYRAERFYNSPVVRIDGASLITDTKTNAVLNLTVWNSFRERMSSVGQVSVYDGEDLLYTDNFVFLPFWQDTDLSFNVTTDDYKKGIYNLTLIIENSDGISTIPIFFYWSIERAPVEGWVIAVSITVPIVVLAGAGTGTYFYLKKKKKKN